MSIDDTRSASQIAVLGRFTDELMHARKTAFVDKIDDQLQLVQALEVCRFGLISGSHESVVTGSDQLGNSTAQNGLLAEKIGFSLLGKARGQNGRARTAQSMRVGERHIECFSGGVLMNGQQARNAATFGIGLADQFARALGSDEDDIVFFSGIDLTVMNVESMREKHCRSGLEIRRHFLFIKFGLSHIGHEDGDQVCILNSLSHGDRLETIFRSLIPGLAARTQSDVNVETAVLQVQSMGSTLAAIADDGYFLALQDRKIDILFSVNLCHELSPSFVSYFPFSVN